MATPLHATSSGHQRTLRNSKGGSKLYNRKDKRLTAKCKVCDIHFEDDGIVKHYHHVVAGQEILIARGKWELAPGAIPRLFPALPPHISKPKLSGSRRKSAQKRTVSRKSPVPSSSAEEPPEVEQQDEKASGY
ncbi:hypothetical protein HPB48_016397 [Haemaphysalis longicornis]|uniref:Uncharacterized protein n=1 Tax=Haemaphysalis longicornis TaxID=44386 RepID=A0A9J6GJP6_HAELO|nr:hypothetical protein HPB48_016397 [Haemaphysalis longicornis]